MEAKIGQKSVRKQMKPRLGMTPCVQVEREAYWPGIHKICSQKVDWYRDKARMNLLILKGTLV